VSPGHVAMETLTDKTNVMELILMVKHARLRDSTEEHFHVLQTVPLILHNVTSVETEQRTALKNAMQATLDPVHAQSKDLTVVAWPALTLVQFQLIHATDVETEA